jgi:hypothetical protein
MPSISSFYGIAIRIYYKEHPPAHFHALYGDHIGQINIATGEMIRANSLVAFWLWYVNGVSFIWMS